MDFSDYIRACTFPHCVCVTRGNYVNKNVQICCGDVLTLKSCGVKLTTLCFESKNDKSALSSVTVNVTLDSCVKFKVLPPTDADTSDNTLMYPTIADLLLDCPTHFEATVSYDDPYLPGMSVRAGDRFRFVQIIKDFKHGQERLQVRDSKENTIILSQDFKGHFRPLIDEHEYTIRELLNMAPVQRRLIVVRTDVGDEREIFNNSQESDISKHGSKTVTQIYNQNSNTSSLEFLIAQDSLPSDGIVYMPKPELTVIVSPYNDTETTWEVPVIANLKVRTYSQSDYEVPVSKHQQQQSCIVNALIDDDLPMFRAPSAPPFPQTHVPIEIRSFVNIYGSSFPVKAKVINTAEVHPLFQQMLTGVDEIFICRLDVVKRLYVKDTKSNTIFSLSKDVRLSFVEYPQQFKVVSELLCLPKGSEVIVLEDIAADFPKPLSLRFGDIIRVTSNTPSIIKTKLASGDCRVLKCDRIDLEADGNTRLKLPLDFEVTMMLKTDQNCSKLISIHDLLSGVVPLPSQSVTCVSEDVNNETIYELPTHLQILQSCKERCIVVKTFSTFSTQISHSPKVGSSQESSSSGQPAMLTNIGIPLSIGLVLLYTERLSVPNSEEDASEVHFIVPPIEKMTVAQYEERQRHLKEHSNCEDIQSGPSSTMDEYDTASDVTRKTSSDGMLEKKHRSASLNTVRRFRNALNPKYWRQTKSRPPPLPYTSALGLSHFTNRKNGTEEMGFASIPGESTNDESTNLELITRDEAEDENLYEELETDPSKSTTSTAPLCQNGTFYTPEYIPLPPSNTPPKLFSKCVEKQALAVASDSEASCLTKDSDVVHSTTEKVHESFEGDSRKHTSGKYKPLIRVKNWANNVGNSLGTRFSMGFKGDTQESNTVSTNVLLENQARREEDESPTSSSIDFKHSASIKPLELQIPKAKPRTLNKSVVLGRDHCYPVPSHIINEQISHNATVYVENLATLPDTANTSSDDTVKFFIQAGEINCPPKPLPKPRSCSTSKV
ncbi:hypothetical protein BsWGS_02615 [Bradybaena similaris]